MKYILQSNEQQQQYIDDHKTVNGECGFIVFFWVSECEIQVSLPTKILWTPIMCDKINQIIYHQINKLHTNVSSQILALILIVHTVSL